MTLQHDEPFVILLQRVWEDPAFVDLGTDAKLVFLWAWTRPDAPISGLGKCDPMAMPLGIDSEGAESEQGRVADALTALAGWETTYTGPPPPLWELRQTRKQLVLFDSEAQVLWVVNRARHANRSARAAKMIQREYRACPASPLKDQFADRYRGILAT